MTNYKSSQHLSKPILTEIDEISSSVKIKSLHPLESKSAGTGEIANSIEIEPSNPLKLMTKNRIS